MTTCTCNHSSRPTLNGALRTDPTRTLSLRRSFMADIQRRFDALKKEVIYAVDTLDVFGLGERSHQLNINILTTNLEPRQFEFAHSDQKIDQFMKWLDEMTKKHILTVTSRTDFRVGEKPWTNLYIQSAYQRGISRARAELRRKGYDVPSAFGATQIEGARITAAFNQPFHADRVAMIYTRTFNELKGITGAMSQQMSRVLAQGMAEGKNPYAMARELSDRIDAIGVNRGKTLARTEVVSAHHQATINEYEQWGVQGVDVQAEWLTAGFGVCPRCAPLQGKVFSLQEIRGMIPRHPNCRCVALPVVNPQKAARASQEPRAPRAPRVPSWQKTWKKLPDNVKFFAKRNPSDDIYDKIDEAKDCYLDLANRYPGIKRVLHQTKLDTFVINSDSIREVPNGRVLGTYLNTNNSIEIAGLLETQSTYRLGPGVFNTATSFLGSIRHELGHHIHYNCDIIAKGKGFKWLGPDKYTSAMADLYRSGIADEVCAYAKTNEKELFATCFTVFTDPTYKGDLPKELHDFFIDLLS